MPPVFYEAESLKCLRVCRRGTHSLNIQYRTFEVEGEITFELKDIKHKHLLRMFASMKQILSPLRNVVIKNQYGAKALYTTTLHYHGLKAVVIDNQIVTGL
jgi:hypothetical protein